MSKKKETKIIKLNSQNIIMQLQVSQHELDVLKYSLRDYGNGYGLALLKRIKREEDK